MAATVDFIVSRIGPITTTVDPVGLIRDTIKSTDQPQGSKKLRTLKLIRIPELESVVSGDPSM